MQNLKKTDLTLLGGAVGSLPATAVYGLSVVRNEIERLPYLLSYYRSIGVRQFLFISDHSTDGTTEFLLEQDDCAVFLPKTSFKDSRCGVDWQNELLDRYCTGRWVITFDADEIFVYPHVEAVSLPEFCGILDEEGANVVQSFLLDMYSDGPIAQSTYSSGQPFVQTSPFFDTDYRFIPARAKDDYVPGGKVIGGPRGRLFYSFQNAYTLLSRLCMYVGVNVLPRVGLIRRGTYHYVPTLLKAPLVKWQAGFRRNSNHNIAKLPNVVLSNMTSAVLHFKFFSDFHQRAVQEISRGQHYNGAQEYVRYVSYVDANPDFNFFYSGSARFESSADLLRAGLIRSSPALDDRALANRSSPDRAGKTTVPACS